MSSRIFNEINRYLKNPNDINCQLNFVKSVLRWNIWISFPNKFLFIIFEFIIHINIREDRNIWRNNKIVYDQQCDCEIPNLAWILFCINQVPSDLGLVINDLRIIIIVIVNVINHHFSEVLFGHFLKTSLQSKFIVVTSSFLPKLFNSHFLFIRRKFTEITSINVSRIISLVARDG